MPNIVKPFIDPTAGELVVSWDQYHALIEHLALLIHDRGCPFDQVVALSRGGRRVGDVLSRLFNRPLVVMAASSYGGQWSGAGLCAGWAEPGPHVSPSWCPPAAGG